MNRFKFFMAMLLAGGTTLAFYGCGDNQSDNAAKKAEEPAAEVKVQDDAAAKKAEEEAKKAKAEAEKKAQEEAKAKAEAEKKAQEEAKKAKEAAILAQAEKACQNFINDVRSNKIRMGGGARNRVLNYKNDNIAMVTDSYVIFCGYSSGAKISLHVVKENGVWQCVDMNPDWDVDKHYIK